MISCEKCINDVPIRSYLWRLRFFSLRCPSCSAVLRAGVRSRKIFWRSSVVGGVVGGAAASYVRHFHEWSYTEALSFIIFSGILAGLVCCVVDWRVGDYKEERSAT